MSDYTTTPKLGLYKPTVDAAAATPVYNATLAAGGTVVLPVFCDGTNWKNH